MTQGVEAEETAKFVEYMDKFFDALNVSNFTEGKKKRKPFQNPYRSDTDFRLTVSCIEVYHFIHDTEVYHYTNSG